MSPSASPETLALHHLLLRELERVVAERGVKPTLHRTVAESLGVAETDDGARYEVTWQIDGASASHCMDRQTFALFHPGDDARTGGRAAHLASRNERRARELVLLLLGLEPVEATRARPKPLGALLLSPRALVLPAAVIAAGGVPGIVLGAALAIWAIVDRVPRVGALLAVLPLTTLAYADLPHTALIGGITYALLEALDPDPRLRWARVLVLAAAIAFAAWLTPAWVPPAAALPWIAPAVGIATAAFLWRWRLGTYHHALPLVLPWLALGLAWDGRPREAAAILTVSLLASAALTLASPWTRRRRMRSRP